MICLACAAKHPQFMPPNQPTPMQAITCQLCEGVEWCVANHKVGLPDKFLTVDEAFKLIAANLIEPPKD